MESQLISKFKAIVGENHVLTDPSLVEPYASDWTDHYRSQPLAVVRVTNREQVAAILRVCYENKINVIPQGGNTGLVGGSVGGEFPHIILSTKTLRNDMNFDSTTNGGTPPYSYAWDFDSNGTTDSTQENPTFGQSH